MIYLAKHLTLRPFFTREGTGEDQRRVEPCVLDALFFGRAVATEPALLGPSKVNQIDRHAR